MFLAPLTEPGAAGLRVLSPASSASKPGRTLREGNLGRENPQQAGFHLGVPRQSEETSGSTWRPVTAIAVFSPARFQAWTRR